MNKRIAPVLALAFLITSVLCVSLWRAGRKMEAENNALRFEIKELKATAQAHPPQIQPDSARAADLEAQRELLRLRNEVSQLRANRDTERRNATELANGGVASGRASTSDTATDGQSIPTADWKFAGYQTPQAALLSAFSAMKEGQLAQLLESFAPEERQRFEAQIQAAPQSQIAETFQKEFGQVTGLRALGQREIEPDKIALDVYLEGSGQFKKYVMHRVNGEWKAAGSLDQNSYPSTTSPTASMAYYMQNPELMKRYFPQMYKMMMERKQQEAEQATATTPK